MVQTCLTLPGDLHAGANNLGAINKLACMFRITRLHLMLYKRQGQQDYIWYGVAIGINIFYHSWVLHCGSMNECKLLLAIYVQGKNISRKSCIHKNILPWTLLSMKYFLNYGNLFTFMVFHGWWYVNSSYSTVRRQYVTGIHDLW